MMRQCQTPLPRLWLIGDARNDAVLERALKRLPHGSGFIFRHYHLPAAERRARFARLSGLARARGLTVVLAGTIAEARRWGADGIYGPPSRHAHASLLRLATAHSLGEIGAANRAGANAILLSPVFATRSHAYAKTLGPLRFRLLAAHACVPVIALGGMDKRAARRLAWPRWAAIDGLSRADS